MNRIQPTFCLLILAMPLSAGEKLNVANPVPELQRMSGQIENLSAQVGPKVVQIVTQSLKISGGSEEQPAGVLVAERGCGSGFFVSADGYLLTNAHVIANATRIKVMVQPASGSAQPGAMLEYPGTLIGLDTDNDLALLKIDVQGMPFFDLRGHASPRQGEFVLAYGSPLGLSQSATFGMVSAVDRQLSPDDPRTYIQTDASINPGNSGGPLVDLDGALLGINTMILSQSGGSEGVGLAVPREVVDLAYSAIREHGAITRPRLGIQPRSLTPDLIAGLRLKVHQGVLVEDVAPYGAGATAGLLPGDVLVSLDGEPIRNIRDLYRAESGITAGKAVDLAVMRLENLRLLSITPDAAHDPAPILSPGAVSERDNLIFRLGLYGATVTPSMASSLGGLREPHGVLVLALAGSGLSAPNAIAPGDVVHEVNGSPVDDVEGLRAALDSITDGAPAVLQIERAGVRSYVALGGNAAPDRVPRKASSVASQGIGLLGLTY